MRNKGKVHPFISSRNKDELSVLNLLPAAILTLISLLSHEEREVLAYMIARSIKSTNPSFCPAHHQKNCSFDGRDHKSLALFDCGCFHCYTSFWFRWDSSPNRELIHQAIEAFEENLNNGEQFKKNKRKDKIGCRAIRNNGAAAVKSSDNIEASSIVAVMEEAENQGEEFEGAANGDVRPVAAPVVVVHSHKGLARKVLPDVMGIFSSRLWSLWSPKV